MRRSTIMGSRMWLMRCLISSRFSSLLLCSIQNIIMIRKALRLAHPSARLLHPSLTFTYAPLSTPAATALIQSAPRLTTSPSYAFSQKKDGSNSEDPKEKKKEDAQKKGEQANKQASKQQTPNHQQSTKPSKSLQQQVQDFVNNFWQKGDPNDPSKKPPSKAMQLAKKFELLIEYCMNKAKAVYYRRFSVSGIAITLLAAYCLYKYFNYETQLTPQAFMELLKMESFKEIAFVQEEYFRNKEIRRKKVTGVINNQTYSCEVLTFDEILDFVVKNGHVKYTNIRRTGIEVFFNRVYNFLDMLLIIFIIGTIVRAPKNSQMGRQGTGQQPKKFEVVKKVNVKFADVAGLHESKREVQEVVDFLKRPEKYHALGATIPKGVLLTGPPGTGKTLLAKACAGQAGVPFFSVSGSDFVEVFVGVGASRVRQLFHQAKEQSPSIIFIDELDAVGKKRENKMGSNDQRESTLNQLLVEMDGFGTNSSVIVMAATNRKEILDNALVRAGRFDREVEVGLPDLRGRFEILLVHLTPIKLSPKYTKEEYAKRIASLTPGFSGAELANLCNEAAILAARCAKDIVEMLDFELSSERVIGGVQRKGFVSINEKKTVAYHESGHAVVSWFLQGADPLLKVTIIPRSKGALGFAQYFLNENQLQTKEELLDRICFILGGRLAEQHFFNEVTTGAYDDLEKAYNLAYHIVAKFGMDKELGYIAFPDPQYTKPYGEKVEATVDRQIKKIIQQCTAKTKAMIQLHEKHIHNLAEELLVKETLDVRSIQKILGTRPFPINKTFQAYLETEEAM